MAELDVTPGPGRSWGSDAWDGYAADRGRVLRHLWERSRPTGGPRRRRPLLLRQRSATVPPRPDAPVVATELVGTSISSGAGGYQAFRRHLRDNPQVRFFDNRWRGYLRGTVIRERWYADLLAMRTVERPGAPMRTLASFVIESGRPGASGPDGVP